MDAGMREQFLRGQRSFRGPAWRSKAAQEIANLSDRSAAHTWDPLTIDVAKFHALRTDGENGIVQAAAKYPMIEAAILLHDDGAKTDVMKLMILVDSPTEAIAKRVGVEPTVANVWEQLFFDVRELRSAVSWLSIQVIEAERKAGNTALAARMKLALVAGVDGVNAILALDEGAPVDEAERLFQRKLKLHLKFDEAVNVPFDSERKPQPAPLSVSSPESPMKVAAATKSSIWATAEFDMETGMFDREIDAKMLGLELVAQGGA